MADSAYPNLGFDPLPGDPAVAARLRGDARVFGDRMLTQSTKLARIAYHAADQAYRQPVVQQPDSPLPRRDSAVLDAAEDALGAVLREAQGLREEFEESVDDLARAIRGFAEHAPSEPFLNKLKRWAGDVFAATPLGAALLAVHELINQYPEFFNDLANLLGTVSNVLGVLSLVFFWAPGLGQVLAIAALATAGGAALLKTSLYAGHATDPNGRPYVSGRDLAAAWFDVAASGAGIGIGAAANAAGNVARGAPAAFGAEMAESLTKASARQAGREFVGTFQLVNELGVKGAARQLGHLQKMGWQMMGGAERVVVAGGHVFNFVSPMQSAAIKGDASPLDIAGLRAVGELPGDVIDLATNDPDVPDLRVAEPDEGPQEAFISAPGSGGPAPVMGE